MCDGNGIGKNGGMPWRNAEDLKHFSRTTKGQGNNAVVMGWNTWISIGERPLPKRHNIILSRAHETTAATVCRTIDEVDDFCTASGFEEVWIVGGAQIYQEFLSREKISECHISRIAGKYDCNTFFPKLGENWQLKEAGRFETFNVECYSISYKGLS